MIGHGLSHITFAGVALGLLLRTGCRCSWPSFFPSLASLGIMKLKEAAGLHGDTAIAIVSSVGLALGIVLASIPGNFRRGHPQLSLRRYPGHRAGRGRAVHRPGGGGRGLVAAIYHRFMFMTFDRESARVAGVPRPPARRADHRPDRRDDRPGDEDRGDIARGRPVW